MKTPCVLQLRRGPAAQREAVAWFLPGGGPENWLAELCTWQVPLETLRCYVVPRSATDYRAGGLLVIPPKGGAPPKEARALALGAIEGKLFLPIEAELFPPVTAAEAAALCRATVALFHPTIGLVEFESTEARGVWEWLAPAEKADADWNAAQAGVALHSRLAGVMLQALPGMDDIFGEAKKDIGSEPIVDLPPRPGEPSTGLDGKIGRKFRQWSAGAVMKLFSLLPKNSPRRTWVNDVLDWAGAKLGSVNEEMDEARNQELLRLMHLLESDPDRGLRHALPLGGDPARGRTTPTANLGSRVVDFNLRNLGGGRPNDPWNVPWQLRQKLTARYRELAMHEQQLGRFKRAAYIHAELLGDLSAAAAVLKEGRHYAEAAVLYRDHLRQPSAAAQCFVEGALFAEAIAIYEKEGQWLELGDLHRRLANEEAATAAYRRVVEERIARMDFVGAAALLEKQLRSPEEALALLRHGWRGAQAAQCLGEEFALLSRLARHGAAMKRLAELREEATPGAKSIALAGVLNTLRNTYPDTGVRHVATDLARVKISDRLVHGAIEEVRQAVQIVARLAPEDRLLARDTSRFLAARTEELRQRKSQPPPLPPPRKAGSNRLLPPTHLGSISLPTGLEWMAVRRVGKGYFATTRKAGQVVFVRGNWRGDTQRVVENLREGMKSPKVDTLSADEALNQPNFILPLPLRRDGRSVQTIPATDQFPEKLRAGVPAWAPSDAWLISISGAQWWLLRFSGLELILEERAADGRLLGNFDISALLEDAGEQAGLTYLLVMRLHVWIACGVNLMLFKGGKIERRWQMESPIIGLEASAPFLACAVVVRCTRGAAVFWLDALSERVEMIASELERPLAVFLGNGALVLLSGKSDGRGCDGLVVDIDRRGIHGEEKFYKTGTPPIGLVSTDRPDDFAIFDGTTQAQIWRLPTK